MSNQLPLLSSRKLVKLEFSKCPYFLKLFYVSDHRNLITQLKHSRQYLMTDDN